MHYITMGSENLGQDLSFVQRLSSLRIHYCLKVTILKRFVDCRQRQTREAARRTDIGDRDLTRAPRGTVPPPYSVLESDLSDVGETTETSMSEPEPTDEPISPPPAYTP